TASEPNFWNILNVRNPDGIWSLAKRHYYDYSTGLTFERADIQKTIPTPGRLRPSVPGISRPRNLDEGFYYRLDREFIYRLLQYWTFPWNRYVMDWKRENPDRYRHVLRSIAYAFAPNSNVSLVKAKMALAAHFEDERYRLAEALDRYAPYMRRW